MKNLLYTLLSILTLQLCCLNSWGQTTYFEVQDDVTYLVDRLQTKAQQLNTSFTLSSQPLSRKQAIGFLKNLSDNNASESNTMNPLLNYTDQEQINKAIATNGEWITDPSGMDAMQRSRRPFLKYFYTTTSNFYHYDDEDFFIVANPVVGIELGKEKNEESFNFKNIRGAAIRGRIKNKVGFYTFLADNQERPMSYILNWEDQYKSFPGYEYYRRLSNNNFDVFLGRAYIDFNAINDHVNVSFGYDKQFIGNGIRSLILSDFSAPSTFLRLRSKWNKFHYENLFMELVNQFPALGNDDRLPKKYASIHQLTWSAAPWLELSLIESTIFNYNGNFHVSNIIPIIGFQSIARSTGQHQQTNWGLQFKVIPVKKVQVYGQTLIEGLQFKSSQYPNLSNRFAAQLGIKYFDVAGIPNLDLRLEGNYISPFMYSNASYTNYNQPLAHPMGANTVEGIIALKYAANSRFEINANAFFNRKGIDINNTNNFGGNLFKSHLPLTTSATFQWLNGNVYNGMFGQLNISYELFPNLWIDAGGIYLQSNQVIDETLIRSSPIQIYGGLRWNIARKQFAFKKLQKV